MHVWLHSLATWAHCYILHLHGDSIREKEPLHAGIEFLSLIVHNFKAVVAAGLKPGMAILQLLQYTRKFRIPPTSDICMPTISVAYGLKLVILCLTLDTDHFR